jgi:hypothetical protein
MELVLSTTQAVAATLTGGPPSTAVEFIVSYADGTAGQTLPATTDANGGATATFVTASTSAYTVTVAEVLATATEAPAAPAA